MRTASSTGAAPGRVAPGTGAAPSTGAGTASRTRADSSATRASDVEIRSNAQRVCNARHRRRRANVGIALAAGVLGGLVGAVAALVLMTRFDASEPSLATVDVVALIDAQSERLRTSAVAPDRASEAMQLWSTRLEATLARFAAERGLVLLARPALIAGANDLTDVIAQEMRNDALAR